MYKSATILIRRKGRQYGPYTPKQVEKYLAAGKLAPTDLAWNVENATWDSLKAVAEGQPSSPLPMPHRDRDTLVFFGFVWWIIIFFGLFVGAAVVGMFIILAFIQPKDPEAAGAALGYLIFLPGAVISSGLATWLTLRGKLPGTKYWFLKN